MAWEADVKALKTPVRIITGDADVATLEHSVALFKLLGGGWVSGPTLFDKVFHSPRAKFRQIAGS